MNTFLQLTESKLTAKGLKPLSIKTYQRDLTKLRNNVISTSKTLKYFKRTEKIKTYLDTIDNLNTRNNVLKPILTLLRDESKFKDTYEFYSVIMRDIRTKIETKKKENKFTKKEKDNLTKWKEIKKIKPSNLDEEIFLSLLINDNLFLRLEYFDIKLDEYNTTTDNYIDGPFLYMNSFKNVKTFGPQKFDLSDETTDIIERIKGSWLMTNHNILRSSRSNWISNFFKKHLNKSINNNLLRKIYVNEVLKKNLSTNKLDKIARKMLNTFNTWNNNYRKVN